MSKARGPTGSFKGEPYFHPWVVHYPRTVWKNSYAGHEVTGKTYNLIPKEMDIGRPPAQKVH